MPFCTGCGKELTGGEKFCRNCGKPVAPQGAKQAPEKAPLPQNTLQKASETAKNVIRRVSTAPAASAAGEITVPAFNPENAVPSPFKVIANGVGKVLRGIPKAVKEPKYLVTVVVLAAVWLAVDLLPALGINPLPVRILSLLTFGQAGMSNTFSNMIAGAVGKGLFAGFILSLLNSHPLQTLKSGLGKLKKSPKEFFGDLFSRYVAPGKGVWAYYLFGLTAAVLFLGKTAPLTPWSLFGGAAATALAGRAAGRKGFLSSLLTALFGKLSGKSAGEKSAALLKGLTTGFGGATVFGLLLGNVYVIDSALVHLTARNLLAILEGLALTVSVIGMLIRCVKDRSGKGKSGENGKGAAAV